MTKVRDGLPRRAKAAGLDRLKAALERIVQPRQLGLGHLVVSIRENQIDVSLGQTRRCIARDAAILDVDTDRLHASKPTLPDAEEISKHLLLAASSPLQQRPGDCVPTPRRSSSS